MLVIYMHNNDAPLIFVGPVFLVYVYYYADGDGQEHHDCSRECPHDYNE